MAIKDGLRKTWELETAAEGWRGLGPWSVMCDGRTDTGMQHSLLHCVQSPSPLLAVLTHSHIIITLPTASTSHSQYPCLEITTKKVCLTIVALPRSHAAVSHEDTWVAGYWAGHRLVWCSVNVK